MNKVMLIGNLTRDAEVRHTNSGFPITEMGIAVNDRRKNAQTGDWEEKPFFFNMKMLGERGEKIAQYLTKGKKVAVVGRLEYRAWETPAGEKRSVVEVVVEDLDFMSAPGSSDGGSFRQEAPASQAPQAGRSFGGSAADDLGGVEVEDEEIPF
jgi:single-strand DNA-binding protein